LEKSTGDSSHQDLENESIGMLEILVFFWREKFLISFVTIIFALGSVVYALSLENIYMADARLLAEEQSGDAVAGLSSQLGGLANLAGVNLGGLQSNSNKAQLAIEILRSRKFFEEFLYEEIIEEAMAVTSWDMGSDVLQFNESIYDSEKRTWRNNENGDSLRPSLQAAFEKYSGSVEIVKEGQYASIMVSHVSPKIAKRWIELIITSINEHLRKRDSDDARAAIEYLTNQQNETALVSVGEVFSRLIEEQTKIMMLTNVKKDYVFRVIDPPVVSEERVRPNRAMTCVLYTIVGGFLGVIAALLRARVREINWDKVAF
jgi:LPS O-antigen subunit length determinant protein (WzzB/FepE family)